MRSRIDIELGDGNKFIQTYGGQMKMDDGYGCDIDDYGITIGEITISNIKGEQLKRLAIEAINHLMLNGHKFDIIKTGNIDLPTELIEVK